MGKASFNFDIGRFLSMLTCRRLTPFYLVKQAVFSERSAALVSTYNEMRLGGVMRDMLFNGSWH